MRPVALAMFLLVLAGCTSEPTSPVTTATGPAPDMEPASGMPPWQPGESWLHHWYFGPDDSQGILVRSIVTNGTGTEGVMVATDSNQTAALHSAFIFPTLGWFGDADQSAAAPGEVLYATALVAGQRMQWPWYRFPLRHDDGWNATLRTIQGDGVTVFETEVHAKIFHRAGESWDMRIGLTARPGNQGGTQTQGDSFSLIKQGEWLVELRDADGGIVGRYDYSNETHWFTRAEFYDYGVPAANRTEPRFIMVTEEHTMSWKGTAYDATSELLLSAAAEVVPPTVPQPNPTYTFAMDAEDTHMLALPYAFAAGGAWAQELVAPDGRHWELHASDAAGVPGTGALLYVPAVPGEWRVVSQGAGAFAAGGGILAYSVTEQTFQV